MLDYFSAEVDTSSTRAFISSALALTSSTDALFSLPNLACKIFSAENLNR